jgi:hypothetical protein
MKTVYLIIIIVLYIFRTLIGYTQKISGDQSKVSMREAKYPILTSVNPLGQPFYILSLMGIFIWLLKIQGKN